MSLFRSLIPGSLPAALRNKPRWEQIRERLLQALLLFGSLAGISAVALSSPVLAANQQTGLIVAYLLLCLLGIAASTLRNRLPWITRLWIALFLLWAAGTVSFVQHGFSNPTPIFLISFVLVWSLLLGTRGGLISLGIMVVTSLLEWGLGQTPSLNLEPESLVLTQLLPTYLVSLFIVLIAHFGVSPLVQSLQENQVSFRQLESEKSTLAQSLEDRDKGLQRSLIQLNTASTISRIISTIKDPHLLIQQVAELIKDRFDFYYVGVFLLDESGEFAVLNAGTGEAGQKMMAAHHRLAVGGYSMIGGATGTRQARIALDVGEEAVRFDNPYLPETRSEMAMPIIGPSGLLGALTIQSSRPRDFDENDIKIIHAIADSLGIAIENAAYTQKTEQALEEVRALNRIYLQQAWQETTRTHSDLSFTFENPVSTPTGDVETSTMRVPLMLRDEPIGEILLEMNRDSLSKDDLTFLDSITTQTTLALENARLLDESQRRAVQEVKLNEITSQIARAVSIDEILKTAAAELGQLPAVVEASVALVSAGAAAIQPEDQAETVSQEVA